MLSIGNDLYLEENVDDLLDELVGIYDKLMPYEKGEKIMAQLPKQYKTSELVGGGGGFAHIPAGTYKAVIVNSEIKENSKKTGYFLQLNIVVTEGQYMNTEFTERLNIVNQNSVAEEIAYKTLARISEAVGLDMTPKDSSQLHNKQFLIDVSDEKGDNWEDDNGVVREGSVYSVIKKYKPLANVGLSSQQFAGATPMVTPSTIAPPSNVVQPMAAPWAK